MLPLLPRTALHLLNAFIIISILFIIFFPTLGHTKSVYRPTEDIIADTAVPEATMPHRMWLKFQQPKDNFGQEDGSSDGSRSRLQHTPPSSQASTLDMITSTFRVIWSGIIFIGQFVSFILFPLQIITLILFENIIFLLQPFIIMGTGLYTIAVIWPIQLVNYLTKTFYPLYIFLACASIVGIFVGGMANFIATFLNNTIFPPRQQLTKLNLGPRPSSSRSESLPESELSSGSVTPSHPPIRVPPPSKYPSTIDDIHILDTNALFSSFSLPIPPATPPGILHSAPTPTGSVSGVHIGETIFEEDDDSDEKTPVATLKQEQESWGFGAGKPLMRAESAHGRNLGQGKRAVGAGTWHERVKREDVDAQGIDWGEDSVRRRKLGVAV